ncbi:right-handed parallel beta-helix repeat-containing protein [Candidatus Uhrbacteria bacterium]|nr:right-handed parallel beta-helix repeat-containing protein [Candidatus Uhrbacteria bacterium]
MKNKVLMLIMLIGLSGSGFFFYSSIPQRVSNRDVFGTLKRNQIWSGRIRVTGDILVMPWVTVTILPGTIVTVSANKDVNNLFGRESCDGIENYDLLTGMISKENDRCGAQPDEPYRDEANHISIIIRGVLRAVGTKDKRITLRSDSQNPTRYDWNRLEIKNGIVSYADISDYRILAPMGDSTEISHSILSNIGECGICLNNNRAEIFSDTISNAGHESIDMHNSSPIIRNNHFGPNPNRSCLTINGGAPQITGNTIEKCGSGISLLVPPSDPTLEERLRKENTFLNNTKDFYFEY